VEMTMGFADFNGGWWATLTVEAIDGQGQWRPVENLEITPPYCFENYRGERRPYQTYYMTFTMVYTRALRLIGRPGGQDEFTSLARIGVRLRTISRARPEREVTPPPIPDLFRVISPSTVWDLSAGLSKVIGLTINLPLMDYYLDADRHLQSWHTLRRTYQGEPELWFLIGDSIGWDTWEAVISASVAADSPYPINPHVRLILDGGLAQAVAPVSVAGRLLCELTTRVVIVRDHFNQSWHRRFAKRSGIPWSAYRAAVRRSPQLTMEQLSGVADLMGLIANSVANLAYRLDLAEQDLGPDRRAFRQKLTIRQAIDFMQDHLEEQIGVADVAHAVSLSPHYFTDMFTDNIGLTPNEFMTNLRIERAKEYLTQHHKSPSDVCLALGYSSSYFWRLFKRKTGTTPARFARQTEAQAARR
jgi:AraC-like DNA-binding protein